MGHLEGEDGIVPIHHATLESIRTTKSHRRQLPNVEPERPPPAKGEPPAEPSARRGHALDFAPVNTKIVVLLVANNKRQAAMSGPDGHIMLPDGDDAHKLPVGAKITKTGEHTYRSEQLDAVDERTQTVHDTAIEAIAAFTQHFHG